jgi:hypothetical protein
VLPQEQGMVGSTRSAALLLVMFPLGYLLSRLVIVHLDWFGEVSSQLSRSLLFYLISLYYLFWFWWHLNLFLILFVLYFFSGLRWGSRVSFGSLSLADQYGSSNGWRLRVMIP